MSSMTEDVVRPLAVEAQLSAQGDTATPSKRTLKKQQKQRDKEHMSGGLPIGEAMVPAELPEGVATQNYGRLPLNQSQERTGRVRTSISNLRGSEPEQDILLRARLHLCRGTRDVLFIMLRQRTELIQGVLTVTSGQVSKAMFKWASSLALESVVLVEGVTKTPFKGPVISSTVPDLEIVIKQLFVIAPVTKKPLPFDMADAARPAADVAKEGAQYNNVLLDNRLDNRVLDLRTKTNQAIFEIQDAVSVTFQNFLRSHGFMQIHSPKLLGAASESGAAVFRVDYFKDRAFLAQSPQLAKQMAISADFERVYEIGPVFRAENAHTHRHLTEFTGLDLEMVIEEHYHEVLDLLDSLFLHLFSTLRDQYSRQLEIIEKQFPIGSFKWREDGTLRLTFAEAVDLLVADGVPREDLDDINTENEKRLGRLVKAKYETDYFIVDKFPLALRPFYTMPDATNGELSNSYDFFIRGEEVLSGAQRIHDPDLLVQQMKAKQVDPLSLKAYIDAFELGCPPHGGGGIGLERVVMLYLGLGDVRRASLFPRDPKRLEP